MSTPVTRGELREELQQLEQRVEQRFDRIDQRFVESEARFDRIDQRFVESEARFDRIDQRFVESEARFDHKLEVWGGALLARMEASEQRLIAELGRHVRAVEESMRAQIGALDDKYGGLAARVRRPKPSS